MRMSADITAELKSVENRSVRRAAGCMRPITTTVVKLH